MSDTTTICTFAHYILDLLTFMLFLQFLIFSRKMNWTYFGLLFWISDRHFSYFWKITAYSISHNTKKVVRKCAILVIKRLKTFFFLLQSFMNFHLYFSSTFRSYRNRPNASSGDGVRERRRGVRLPRRSRENEGARGQDQI